MSFTIKIVNNFFRKVWKAFIHPPTRRTESRDFHIQIHIKSYKVGFGHTWDGRLLGDLDKYDNSWWYRVQKFGPNPETQRPIFLGPTRPKVSKKILSFFIKKRTLGRADPKKFGLCVSGFGPSFWNLYPQELSYLFKSPNKRPSQAWPKRTLCDLIWIWIWKSRLSDRRVGGVYECLSL